MSEREVPQTGEPAPNADLNPAPDETEVDESAFDPRRHRTGGMDNVIAAEEGHADMLRESMANVPEKDRGVEPDEIQELPPELVDGSILSTAAAQNAADISEEEAAAMTEADEALTRLESVRLREKEASRMDAILEEEELPANHREIASMTTEDFEYEYTLHSVVPLGSRRWEFYWSVKAYKPAPAGTEPAPVHCATYVTEATYTVPKNATGSNDRNAAGAWRRLSGPPCPLLQEHFGTMVVWEQG